MRDAGDAEKQNGDRSRRLLSWLLKAGLSALLLCLVFAKVPLEGVTSSLGSARPGVYAVACIVALSPSFIHAFRMKHLTDRHGMSLSYWRHFEINMAASFYGLFLPGFLSGGVFRWYRISRPDGNVAGAFAVVVVNRFLQTSAIALLGVVFLAIAGPTGVNPAAAAALAGILLLFVTALAVLMHGLVSIHLGRFLAERKGIPEGLRRRALRVVDAFGQYRGMGARELLPIAGCCIAEEALASFSFVLTAISMGISVSFASLGWVRSCVAILTTLPVSIGGFGLREGSLIVLLAPFGVGAKVAVAFSLLTFAAGLPRVVLGGMLEAGKAMYPGGRSRP